MSTQSVPRARPPARLFSRVQGSWCRPAAALAIPAGTGRLMLFLAINRAHRLEIRTTGGPLGARYDDPVRVARIASLPRADRARTRGRACPGSVAARQPSPRLAARRSAYLPAHGRVLLLDRDGARLRPHRAAASDDDPGIEHRHSLRELEGTFSPPPHHPRTARATEPW